MNELTFEKLPQAVTQIYDKLEKIERLLESQNNVARIDNDKLLTIREAAEVFICRFQRSMDWSSARRSLSVKKESVYIFSSRN